MTKFTKDPSTHPAHGPLTEERLIRVSDEMAAAAKRSDGGNLGYLMADAAKAIEALLAVRKMEQEPVAYYFPGGEREIEQVSLPHDLDDEQKDNCIPLYAAPQLPQPAVPDEVIVFLNHLEDVLPDKAFNLIDVKTWNGVSMLSRPDVYRAAMLQGAESVSQPYTVPDGYCIIPMKLTAENGAKDALSGEFSETKFINCPECFGDDECETCDGSGRIEISVPVSWTTIKEIWAKGVEHFAAAPQREVK
ncbi:hypothetical protein FR773_10045 [Leclercia adecarboxylata]|uniref:hypothetical protein n=1 Tax=Leclercia adecarboxylata TaxID=83655 RepID=UPI0012A79678|nr:hypothetical protein [Leclercia adecarboxylata]QFH65050.1 hypothetical protein FR773_10045 [Leclercia adecarboxylata]